MAHSPRVSSTGCSRATHRKSLNERFKQSSLPHNVAREIRVNVRSTLRQFLKFGDERLRATREVAVELPELLPIAVEHDDCRKSGNLVLLGELAILFSQFGSLRFHAGKIEFYQYQISAGVILKGRLRENIPVELDTPATPV